MVGEKGGQFGAWECGWKRPAREKGLLFDQKLMKRSFDLWVNLGRTKVGEVHFEYE